MKRYVLKTIAFFTFALLTFNLVSCTNNNQETPQPPIVSENEYIKVLPSLFEDDEEPVVITNYMNMDIVHDETPQLSFSFYILSKNKLSENDVKVEIDVDNQFTVIQSEAEHITEKFTKLLYLQYNNVDWEHLKALEASLVDEDIKEYSEFELKTNEEYENIEEFPTFYRHKYTVNFANVSNFKGETSFNEIDVIIKDKTYTKDIGEITIKGNPDTSTQEEKAEILGDHELYFTSGGRIGVRIPYNSDGLITAPTYEMVAKEDVTIKDIYVTNDTETISIDSVMFNLASDDINLNQEWIKGEDIEIKAGTNIYAEFVFKDLDFIDHIDYAQNISFTVEYEFNGKTQIASTGFTSETRYPAEEQYASHKDKIDMTSYYEMGIGD